MTELLRVEGLVTEFDTETGPYRAADGVDLHVAAGEVLGLVGESGSGKTVTALSILRLIGHPGRIAGGRILFEGQDLAHLSEREMLRLRGDRISMIFQQPKACLNPVIRVGRQVAELFQRHRGLSRRRAMAKALELLISVGIPTPEQKINAYPHELSGGQAQRIMIAMALALEPRLLIADEPTTALDVTLQAQILDLLKDMCARTGTAMILVTHDMGVVAQTADRVSVMYKGRIVEEQPVADLFARPRHAYTKTLLASIPKPGGGRPAPADTVAPADTGEPLLCVQDVSVQYPIRAGLLRRTVDHVTAVDDVSLDIAPGETLGLVGESGSGKTTLGRAILGLDAPSAGRVTYRGQDLSRIAAEARQSLRRDVQLIFQDPYSALDPQATIGSSIRSGLDIHGLGTRAERRDRVAEVMRDVGLDPQLANRYPHEFSGGMRQRVVIARALILKPKLVICDEPTSALDVSIQAQVLQMLADLKARMGLTLLFISHDLGVVEQIADRVAVMYRGRIVETGPTDAVFTRPRHAYTRTLLASIPVADPTRRGQQPGQVERAT